MKAFWALMALLAIATVVMFAGDLGGAASTPPASPAATPPVAPSKSPPPAATPTSVEAPAVRPEVAAPSQTEKPAIPPATLTVKPDAPAAAPVETPTPPDPAPASTETITTTPEPATPKVETPVTPPTATTPAPAIETPLPASTEDENLLIKLRQEIEAERAKREAAKLITTESPSAESPAAGTAAPAAQGSGIFGAAAAEAKSDGSILVEGKYIVKGKGTQAEPYKITWDQLISAERDYAPKDGKKSIPDRIQALNDMWVEITGYVAFPLMANETDEMLSMMNQWDGCCIGIPPTPYDAIEVRLSTPVTGDGRLTTYGVIKGKFKVDPHLVGGWLVGLYVVDQGKLTPVAFGGVAP